RHEEHNRAEEDDGAGDGDQRAANCAAAAPPSGNHRAVSGTLELYFRIGAPVAFASHCRWIRCSDPFALSAAMALSTQAVRLLPFASTMPTCSPEGAANWPRIVPFSTCTAVT